MINWDMISDAETRDMDDDRYKSIVGSKEIKTVLAKTRLAFVRDDLFPNMPLVGWKEAIEGNGKKIEDFLGVVAAPTLVNGEVTENTKNISISLPHYGRADFIPMVFASADGTIFSGLYRKGVGGTRKVIRGDFNIEEVADKPGRAGLSYEDRSMAESEMANNLHKKGVRIRMPVLGLYVDEVLTPTGLKSVEDLVKENILKSDYVEKRPMIVFYARRNPYTFGDAVDFIKEGGNPIDLLKSQAQYLRRENTRESNRVSDLIENDDPEAMRAWVSWMAKTFGEQVDLWSKIGFLHPSFHGQNMTLAIETGDTGDLVDKFELKPIEKAQDENVKVDHADQAFSALFFLNSLLKDMGESNLEKSMIESFVSGMFEKRGGSTNILAEQMLKMMKENDAENEYLAECLRREMH